MTSLIKASHLYDGDVAVYLCGPPPMVEAVRTHVTKAGIEPTGFFYEKFALAHVGAAPKPVSVSASTTATSSEQPLLVSEDARGITGQIVLPGLDLAAHGASASKVDDAGVSGPLPASSSHRLSA